MRNKPNTNFKLPEKLERDDYAWYCKQVLKIPAFIRQRLALRLADSYDKYHTKSFIEPHPLGRKKIQAGRRAANLSHFYKCQGYAEKINKCPAWFDEFHDTEYDQIADYAIKLSIKHRKIFSLYADDHATGKAEVNMSLADIGLKIDASSYASFWTKATDIPTLRKKLHANVRREQDELARRLGEVDDYVSMQARKNHKLHEDAKEHFLDTFVISDGEYEHPMREIVEQSEAGRQAEFYAKIAGLRKLQDLHGHDAVMLTLTAPSAYHAKIKIQTGFAKDGKPTHKMVANSKYQNKTVKQAYQYIQHTHRTVLQHASKYELQVAGFTAYQPHTDGTPHAHLYVIGNREDLEELVAKYEEVNLREGADDAGAAEHRTDIIWEDKNKGSLSSYAARYAGRDAEQDAWYATHKIQKLNWFGLPPANVWRELVRAVNAYNNGKKKAEAKGWKWREKIPEQLTHIWRHVDAGDYAGFVLALCGDFGYGVGLREHAKGVYKKIETRFLEVGRKFDHIVINGFALFTHLKEWVIERRESKSATLVVKHPRASQAMPVDQHLAQKVKHILTKQDFNGNLKAGFG